MTTVRHKQLPGKQRQFKSHDDREEQHTLWNSTSVRDSILHHYIPSASLELDDAMSRWSRDIFDTTSTMSTNSLGFTATMDPNHEAMYCDLSDWVAGTHLHETTDGRDKEDLTRKESLLPAPVELKRPKRVAPPLQCLTSQNQTEAQKKGVGFQDFQFNFEQSRAARPNMQKHRPSHSTIPSLSYSIASSPPATPPMNMDSFSYAYQNTRSPSAQSGSRSPLTPPSSPLLLGPSPPSPAISASTAIQIRRSDDSRSIELEALHYQPVAILGNEETSSKAKTAQPHVETSFMDWDDSPSRLARMKKSINDLRHVNNSSSHMSKHRKHTSSRLTVVRTATPVPETTASKTTKLNRMKDFFGKAVGKPEAA